MIKITCPQTLKAKICRQTQESTSSEMSKRNSIHRQSQKPAFPRQKLFFNTDQPAKTRQLVSHIRNIDWIIVNNEVEALLLENKLVKQHTPKYNIDLKDAKTFAYISLTREPYPRILTSRKVSRKLESFGPYTEGFIRQDLQRLVVRVFKLRTCKTMHKRACLNFHIHICTAPCIEKVTAEQYAEQVKQARSFLNGNYQQTIEATQLSNANRLST